MVPNERVVEVDWFETGDPTMRGEMTSTITLAKLAALAELEARHG